MDVEGAQPPTLCYSATPSPFTATSQWQPHCVDLLIGATTSVVDRARTVTYRASLTSIPRIINLDFNVVPSSAELVMTD